MAVFRCKMCGGTIEFEQGATVGICDSCGTKQTLPKLDDEKKAVLYDRANHFRRTNDFDKAMGIYEQILNEDNTDAESYWSLVLCKYGIDYVDDPATHKRVPTVNRAQYTSIYDDDDYKSALHYADEGQREIYEAEAKAINEIQKGILAISRKEDPFDVFICYKETDANGRRTPDSVLANDLYYQLTQEGFKVFFSRITLEDKLGTAYEPYIFAALNSAKVMVVLGTKPEYFNAVWVKNEWSRYLTLVKQSGGKKVLIPAYRDMDPYDLPEEFSHLQAQDMSRLGFMQDLIRGIKKLVTADEPKATIVKETVTMSNSIDTSALLKRASLFLADGDWNNAKQYCDRVLDADPENVEAYIYKLMIDLQVKAKNDIGLLEGTLEKNSNYQKIMLFGDEKIKNQFIEYDKSCKYNYAVSMLHDHNYETAKILFEILHGYKDSENRITECTHGIDQQKIEQEKQRLEAEKAARKADSINKQIDQEITTVKRMRNLGFLLGGCILAAIVFASAFPLYNLYYHYNRELSFGDIGYDKFYLFGPATKEIIIGISFTILAFSLIGVLICNGIIKNKSRKKISIPVEKSNSILQFAPNKYTSNIEIPQVSANKVTKKAPTFTMAISDTFFITGRGTVITGNVISGSIASNDMVSIGGETYQVSAIESSHKMVSSATAGMNVGLLISKSSIKFTKGTIVTDASANSVDKFTIKMIDPGINKVRVIAIIRELTGLGLAEAKQLSEFVPGVITTVYSIDTANMIKARLETAGARVEIE